MARQNYQFTSESVSEGHPDKVCDRISDEIVDLFFREGAKAGIDPWTIRAACETLATTNRIVIAGETRGPANVTKDLIAHVARMAMRDIGYEQDGFHWDKAQIDVLLHPQSADIAQGVDAHQPGDNKEEGAGDQGIMFGYACNETPALMPAPIHYAHKILEDLAHARKSGKGPAAKLGPDSKSQVTVRYANGKPVGVTQIVVSHQHVDETLSSRDVRAIVEPFVLAALPEGWVSKDTVWHVNPTGKFYIGGPDGDTRPHRPQDHRRHLRRRGAARRRRLLGQGPDQGRPLGGLRRALSRQERRRRGPGRPLHASAFLCDRRRQAAVDLRRPARDGPRRRMQARKRADGDHEPVAARHSRASQPQQADLRAHLRLRPFRPRAGERRRLLLGEDRSGRAAPLPGRVGALDGNDPRRARRAGRSMGEARARPCAPITPASSPSVCRRSNSTRRPSLRARRCSPSSRSELWLEIGFGGGEHLIAQARAHPDVGFIGCEPFVNGVAKALAALELHGLEQHHGCGRATRAR